MMFEEEQKEEQKQFVMPPLKSMQFKLENEQEIASNTLFIAFYGISSIYISTLVDTRIPITRINFLKSKQKSLASVFRSEDGESCFIVFNDQFQKMKQIHLAEFINKYFKFNKLIILSSVARNVLEKDDGVLLQCLQTSWGNKLLIPHYRQGITGQGVDLLQWAQINGKNAMWFIGIYSDYEIRKENIQDIFGNLNNIFALQYKYDISKQIKQYNMNKYANKLYL